MTQTTPDTTPGQSDEQGTVIRRIRSHQFGEIEVSSKYVFTFPAGLYGFDHLREFILISEENTEPLKWLLSLEDPTIGFPVINPFVLDLSYKIGKSFSGENLVPLVIITLANKAGHMTANMKAPIILDVSSQSGSQVILSSDRYQAEFTIGSASITTPPSDE